MHNELNCYVLLRIKNRNREERIMLNNKLIKTNCLILLTLGFSANTYAQAGSADFPSEAPSVYRPARPGYPNNPQQPIYREPAPICAPGIVFMPPAACCTPDYSVCENIYTGIKTYGSY